MRTSTVVPLPGDDSISRIAADQRGSLLHADQPEPLTGVLPVTWVESHAVVLDDQQHVVRRGARE